MAKNQILKGFQDFLPEVMIPRQQMIEKIIRVFELYGFVPQDTPALEYADLLMGKYGEDEKLIYRFQDNGGREVALRYDLTVPLARVIAMYRGKLPMPYKRYQISKVWRADKPQRGRFREFVQFDADVVGSKSLIIDAEIVAMMCDTMKALGVKNYFVRLNDRRILNGVGECADVPKEKIASLLTAIDKAEKIGRQGLMQELADRGFDSKVATFVDRLLAMKESGKVIVDLRKLLRSSVGAQDALNDLQKIMDDLEARGWKDRVLVDPSIARGLAYYTGTIYETTILDAPEYGSVMSGGRYDQLVKKLGGPDLPAVGTSVGVDRLYAALRQMKLLPDTKSFSDALIINFEAADQPAYGALAQSLRREGISCEIYAEPKKVLNQFQYADQQGIPFVLLMGSKEKEMNQVTLRIQSTREERLLATDEVPSVVRELKSRRRSE